MLLATSGTSAACVWDGRCLFGVFRIDLGLLGTVERLPLWDPCKLTAVFRSWDVSVHFVCLVLDAAEGWDFPLGWDFPFGWTSWGQAVPGCLRLS